MLKIFFTATIIFISLSSESFSSVTTLNEEDIDLAAEIFSGSYVTEGKVFEVSAVRPYFIQLVSVIEGAAGKGFYPFDSAVKIFDQEFGADIKLGKPVVPYSHQATAILSFVWSDRLTSVTAMELYSSDKDDQVRSFFQKADDILSILENIYLTFPNSGLLKVNGSDLMKKPRLLNISRIQQDGNSKDSFVFKDNSNSDFFEYSTQHRLKKIDEALKLLTVISTVLTLLFTSLLFFFIICAVVFFSHQEERENKNMLS